jgi:hypothetical protein
MAILFFVISKIPLLDSPALLFVARLRKFAQKNAQNTLILGYIALFFRAKNTTLLTSSIGWLETRGLFFFF